MCKLWRPFLAVGAAGILLFNAGCNDSGGSQVQVAEEPYVETAGSEGDFPATLNIQLINGNSFGSLPMDPAILKCGESFSAFAHNFSSPPTCDGFRDANSPLVQRSVDQATAFISGITCDAGCTRNQSIVWKGWACGANQERTANLASGFAVSVVSCPQAEGQ